MKNLFKSVSCGNPAKFVWQNASPTATQEWAEAREASKEADEAQSQAVDAMMNLAQKRYEQGAEFTEAVGATISEKTEELNKAIQEKVDAAKSTLWSFAEKMYGKVNAGVEAVKNATTVAIDKMDKVATEGFNAAKDAYNSAKQTAKEVAVNVAATALAAGEAVVDAHKYVYNKTAEGVKAGYDATVEFGEDVAEGVTDAVQTVGDFGRGISDIAKNAVARGRDIRLGENKEKRNLSKQTEDVAVANDNISSLPKSMKNFGKNPGEMIKNIPYKVRKAFVVKNNIIDNYSGTASQNKILFNYLEKNK